MSRVERALLWITILAIPAAVGLGLSLWFTPDEKKGLEKLFYACTTAFGFLGAVGTLSLVWVFLREGTRAVTALKASAYSQIYGRLADLTKALMDGCEERDWFANPPEGDRERAQDPRTHLCDMAFSLFEEVYNQRHKFHLLDDEDWRGWLRTMQSFMSRGFARAYWRIAQSHYPGPFVRAMNDITAGEARPET